jgi:hypothetical protein
VRVCVRVCARAGTRWGWHTPARAWLSARRREVMDATAAALDCSMDAASGEAVGRPCATADRSSRVHVGAPRAAPGLHAAPLSSTPASDAGIDGARLLGALPPVRGAALRLCRGGCAHESSPAVPPLALALSSSGTRAVEGSWVEGEWARPTRDCAMGDRDGLGDTGAAGGSAPLPSRWWGWWWWWWWEGCAAANAGAAPAMCCRRKDHPGGWQQAGMAGPGAMGNAVVTRRRRT